MPAYNLGTATGKIEIDTNNLNLAQGTLNKTGNMLLGVGGLAVAGFAVAVKAAGDFNEKLSQFKAVTVASGADMDIIRQKALQLGRDSAFGAGQVVTAFVELGKAGVSAKEIVAGVGDAAVQLAIASGQSIDKAGADIVQIMRTFGLGAKDAVHISDILAGAANASTIDMADLSVSMKYAGAVASGLGIPMEQTANAIAILGNAGIRGSTGGTALRRILLNLTPTSKKAAEMMQALHLVTKAGGNAFFDAAGHAKSMADIAQILQDHLKGLTDQQKEQALNTIFGNRAVAAANILARAGAQGFAVMNAEVTKTTSLDVMNTRLDNLNGRLKIFKSSVETAFIRLGESSQGPLKQILERLTQLVNMFAQLSPHTQQLIMQIVLLVGGFALLAGGMLKVAAIGMNMVKTAREVHAGLKVLSELAGGKASQAWYQFRYGLLAVKTFIKETMIPALTELWGFLMANPIVLIIAALVALGVGLYELYKHWKPFHEFVDATWQVLQKLWDIILKGGKAALDWLGGHWKDIGLILIGPVGWAIEIWRKFGPQIMSFLTAAAGMVGRAAETVVDAVVDFFKKLPGRVWDALNTMAQQSIDFFINLPARFAYAVGFVIGSIVRSFIALGELVLTALTQWLPALIGWFLSLGVKILEGMVKGLEQLWSWITTLGPMLYHFFIDQAKEIIHAFADAVVDLFNFFIELPGKIWDLLSTFGPDLYHFFVKNAKEMNHAFVDGVVDFFNFLTALPGKIWGFLSGLGKTLYDNFRVFAINAGVSMSNGFMDMINFFIQLPGKIWDGIKDLAAQMWKWFEHIGSSAWDGFKHALFGSPKTKIEYAMLNMVDTTRGVVGDMSDQVAKLNGLTGMINSPTMTLTTQAGAGVATPASYIAPGASGAGSMTGNAPDSTSAVTTGGGDTFYIQGEMKTARQISKEIVADKRVRLRT